jgi:hypothetical protein
MRYADHMRASVLIVFAACGTPSEAPSTVVVAPKPTVSQGQAPRDAGADASTIPPNTILLSPVAMDGPYKSANEACEHAHPCGFTDMTEMGRYTNPSTKTSCPALRNSDYADPNSTDPSPNSRGINMAQLSHKSKDLELRIGSQSCAQPKGMRSEQDIYYMFVKRSDGWWRSEPLWQWSYNDKYGGGSMLVRWNDAKPGRTFVGVMAVEDDLACDKQGYAHSTLELMIRVEPGKKAPVVFAPLVVGERSAIEPTPELAGSDCKASKHSAELDEHWTSDDDLELTGPGTWRGFRSDAGVLEIGLGGDDKPSSVGHYRFTRPTE